MHPPRDKTVAILQSNYIPWKGYFDLIARVDEFILYDDMQYTRRDWRNRNRIKTPAGAAWLTIPIEVKGRFHQPIKDTRIADGAWAVRHWATLQHNYGRAPFWRETAAWLEPLYRECREPFLTDVNRRFLIAICGRLGIRTAITASMDYTLMDGKTQRLVDLCRQAGATRYISGPAARDYIEPHYFEAAGIELAWMDYSRYAEYPQFFPPFDHHVTILDLIFHTGPSAPRYLKYVGAPAVASTLEAARG